MKNGKRLPRLSVTGFLFSVFLVSAAQASTDINNAALAMQDQKGDWRAYGRDFSEQRFSPLTEINASNAHQLKLDWYMELPEMKALVATPLVVDGVMYFSGSNSIVLAVDGKTGKQLWRYDPQVLKRLTNNKAMRHNWGTNRGVAFWLGRVYVATFDGRLIAIDAKTGKEAWSVQTIEPGKALFITGAPRVFNGLVVIGNGGADAGASRGYVTAYSAATGEQRWRTYTVPGNPADGFESKALEKAAKTWNGEWWNYGGGGTVWNAMTYDPKYNRVYLGTGNGAPWNQQIRSPGGGDNLFLCSILALDADTGKYVWHYQTNPGETWDYNSAMDMVLAELDWQGRKRDVILHAPKNGFFYVVDRETGKLLGAEKYGVVNWAERIDLVTGRPVETPEARLPEGFGAVIPGTLGAHNWHAMSFNPITGLVYIPYQEAAGFFDRRGIDIQQWRPKAFEANSGYQPFRGDASPDDLASALVAWDPIKQQRAWTVDLPGFWNGGTVTTAGNLVFQGTGAGELVAYTADSGKALWRFDAGVGISAPPITYQVDGRQYIAVLAGWGGSVYGGSSAFAAPGWQYGQQPRRLLVFSLDGDATAPTVTPPSTEMAIVSGPDFVVDETKASAGEDIYLASCMYCHGFYGIASGGAPDLRGSTTASDELALRQILLKGNLQQRGMPIFDELSEQQVEQLYHYIRLRAQGAVGTDK
jgi:quinohemoprotein ethanol dehydrogenase